MEAEGADNGRAIECFQRAWEIAGNDFEAFIAAHYIARHQDNAENTLKWNLEALNRALGTEDGNTEQYLPSLYLNVGKSYEDMGDLVNAEEIYRTASGYAAQLPDDGYGNMIRRGITSGLMRIGAAHEENQNALA